MVSLPFVPTNDEMEWNEIKWNGLDWTGQDRSEKRNKARNVFGGFIESAPFPTTKKKSVLNPPKKKD